MCIEEMGGKECCNTEWVGTNSNEQADYYYVILYTCTQLASVCMWASMQRPVLEELPRHPETMPKKVFFLITRPLCLARKMPKTDRPLTDFDCLTFDCYGTLVDWESGIYQALVSLYTQLPDDHPLRYDRINLLRAFIKIEGIVQSADPTALYTNVLGQTYGRLAEELGVAASEADKAKFGLGVGDWPIYPDTVDALKRLQEHFKLVILSNVDNDSFKRTITQQFEDIKFDAVYTAENIGSYKPDARNFEYLIRHCEEDLGVKSGKIIHVAQALSHDHIPASAAGLATAWIQRGENVPSAMGGRLEDVADRVSFSWHFKNMGEMTNAFVILNDKARLESRIQRE